MRCMAANRPESRPVGGLLARALDTAGRRIGLAMEAAIRARHLHRLRRTGHLAPGAPLASLTGQMFDVHPGNQVDVLVDGDDAFGAMAEAVAGATRTVHITNWHAQPTFALIRGSGSPTTLGGLLADAGGRGVRTRILLWQGAPVPLIHPTRADAAASATGFNRIDGVRCVLDGREYPLNCHHEKLLVVDDEVAFVGGLDPTALSTDRYDTRRHHPRPGDGWHDAVLRVRGPVVADVVRHFAQRWAEMAGEQLPAPVVPAPAGAASARLVRTIPEKVYRFAPRGDFGVLAAYLAALRSAERLIYLENQFLWAVEAVDVLVDKLRHPPRDDFRILVVLPDRAHSGQDATLGQLTRLLEADAGAGRLLVVTVQSEDPGHHVYVHAKIGIIDDHWLTVGSVNLNSHSLFNDTELNVVVEERRLAVGTREQLWREHCDVDPAGMDPVRYIDDVLRPAATEQSRRRAAGEPPTGRLRLLEHAARRTDLLLGPLDTLLLDG